MYIYFYIYILYILQQKVQASEFLGMSKEIIDDKINKRKRRCKRKGALHCELLGYL